jgi:hypothetical protein
LIREPAVLENESFAWQMSTAVLLGNLRCVRYSPPDSNFSPAKREGRDDQRKCDKEAASRRKQYHPNVHRVIDDAEKRILASGKLLGGFPLPGRSDRDMEERGDRFVARHCDIWLIRNAAVEAARTAG